MSDVDASLSEPDDDGADARRRARLARSMPFDLAASPTHDHGRLARPLSLGEGFGVDSTSGARLHLDDLYQYQTYAGVLAGLPFDPEWKIESALDYARKIFPGHEAPPRALIPTMQTGWRHVRERNGMEYDEPWRILPRITTFARFTSDRPARDSDETYSSIVLVWFQRGFGLPTDRHILDQIVALDWEPYAHGWSW